MDGTSGLAYEPVAIDKPISIFRNESTYWRKFLVVSDLPIAAMRHFLLAHMVEYRLKAAGGWRLSAGDRSNNHFFRVKTAEPTRS